MTTYSDLVTALRECCTALDMCINSSDTEGALFNADQTLLKNRELIRAALDTEHDRAVRAACVKFYGYEPSELDGCPVAYVDHYISDSPGYCGPVAMLVGSSSPDLITVCVMRKGVWVVEASYP